MSTRSLLAASLVLWAGTSLLLGDAPWFRMPSLGRRVAPYVSSTPATHRFRVPYGTGARELFVPLAKSFADKLAGWLGATEKAEIRLFRVHSPLSIGIFRMRQLTASSFVFLGIVALSAAHIAPAPVLIVSLGAVPLVTFLAFEQKLAHASQAWQQDLFSELPVMAEQLAMLLAAGYSTGAAINRLAERSRGATGADLRRVQRRVRQGAPLNQALTEWAELAHVEALGRLVTVLTIHSEAAELSRLVSEEAEAIRQEAHRHLVMIMEKRAEQVWVPVTVAALIPGSIFLAVPFIEALRLFSVA